MVNVFHRSSSTDKYSYELGKFPLCAFTVQMVFTILFALFVDYGMEANGSHFNHSLDPIHGGRRPRDNTIYTKYPVFNDVHVMVVVGFGFLFTFLEKYSYSSIAMNLFLAAIVMQWSILCEGFMQLKGGKITLSIDQMLSADMAAVAALISWGAVLGRLSPLQTLFMALVEVPFYSLCKWLIYTIFKAIDPGASITCHVFGAYFGLALSFVIYRKDHKRHPKEKRCDYLDVFAMIGTMFLWLYWPSFNAALASGDDRHRAIVNTYLSLVASCVMTFTMTSLFDPRSRFNMSHIQNATLAGGIAIGGAATTMLAPYAALIIGSMAAIICTASSKYLTPIVVKRCRVQDTCGVHGLHGLMGIFGGLMGVVMAAMATEDMYSYKLYSIYKAMSPLADTPKFFDVVTHLSYLVPGDYRTPSQQAVFQLVALLTTLAISLVAGAIAGLVVRLSVFDPPSESDLFDDESYWTIPNDVDEEREIESRDRSTTDVHQRRPSVDSRTNKTLIRMADQSDNGPQPSL